MYIPIYSYIALYSAYNRKNTNVYSNVKSLSFNYAIKLKNAYSKSSLFSIIFLTIFLAFKYVLRNY